MLLKWKPKWHHFSQVFNPSLEQISAIQFICGWYSDTPSTANTITAHNLMKNFRFALSVIQIKNADQCLAFFPMWRDLTVAVRVKVHRKLRWDTGWFMPQYKSMLFSECLLQHESAWDAFTTAKHYGISVCLLMTQVHKWNLDSICYFNNGESNLNNILLCKQFY